MNPNSELAASPPRKRRGEAVTKPKKMILTRQFVSVCIVVLAALAVVIFVIPPYRTYKPEGIVRSVIAEAILTTDIRPEIEWNDGARKFWRSQSAEIRFYGVEEFPTQNRILNSVRKHLVKSDLPEIAVRFFPKGRTNTNPVEEIRFILIEK